MEAVECGAAALASVLAYHGKWVPLEKLRVECGISRDGSKASNILKAARRYELKASGYRKGIDGLRDLPLPMILFWNFNHFVVFEGCKNGWYFINDPAQGPRKISSAEFNQSFTGVALSFEKEKTFRKSGHKPSVLRALNSRLQPVRTALVFVILASLFLVIPGLLVPTFSKIFVDKILVQGMSSYIRPLLLAVFLTAIIRYLLSWMQQHYLLRAETKMVITSSVTFFRHVFRLPMEFFAQRYAGEIGNRVQLNDVVGRLLTGDMATTFLNFIMLAFYAALLFSYDIWLTVIGITIAAGNLLVLRLVARKREDLNKCLMQDQGKLVGTTMTGLQMIETLKASGMESDFFSRWAGYQAKVLNAQQKLGLANSMLSIAPTTLMGINTVVILTAGSYRVMDGKMTMGMLIAFQTLMASFLEPVNQLVDLGGKIQIASGSMIRLDDIFNHPTDPAFLTSSPEKHSLVSISESDDSCHTTEPEKYKLSGEITLNNIRFGYSKLEDPLINNFSLKIMPGSRIAFVGKSGSGKSTLARVISGLYHPWQGEILFDNVRREDIPRCVLTNSIAMVDQDIFLFEGTIRENLTMWDQTIPEARIIKAAKDACIHTEIASRPGGYDSLLAEGGRNFSGGQCQRMEIARALTMEPVILIMDEATSALDPVTEKIIDDNLRKRGCTCIIVAHRLSSIRDCDEIIVLDRGKVVQRGTHDQLIEQGGLYGQLVKSS